MLKHRLLQNYIGISDQDYVLPHSMMAYIQIHIQIILYISILYICYIIGDFWYIGWGWDIWGILGIVLYLYYIYMIADRYMDATICTSDHILIIHSNGLWNQNKQYISRESVDSVRISQDDIRSKLWGSGDLYILSDGGETTIIPSIYRPSTQMSMLLYYKKQYLSRQIIPEVIEEVENNNISMSDEKLNMLVDSLSEIVSDYIKTRE